MKVYTVTKLFRGDTVSIRSPWPLERFLEEQSGVRIKMNGVYMTLSKRLVKDRAFQSNKYPQLSKIDGKPYWLIDFKWRPKNPGGEQRLPISIGGLNAKGINTNDLTARTVKEMDLFVP